MTDVRILEEKHMLSILLYLRTCGDGTARKTDIYHAVSQNPRMPDKLVKLMDAGLLSMEYDSNERCTWITLTDKGEEVSERIEAVGEAMA